MKMFIFPCCLGSLALFCVGCNPPESTSTPVTETAPAEETQQLTIHGSDGAYSIMFSPDGGMLASANRDKTVSLWDIQTRQQSAQLTGHRFLAFSLAFSPDGNFLASAGDDYHMKKGEILIWDLSTKQVRKNLETQNVYFSFVCFSPDGKTLASAGPRSSITLWDVETWTQKGVLEPHSNEVCCLDFSPDGKLLAAGVSHYNRKTQQAEVKLWNLESGKEIGTLEHRWSIETVCFTADSKTLTVEDEGQVILWDVESLQHRQVIDTLATNSSRVAISPDEDLLAMCRKNSLSLNQTKTGNQLATIPANQHFGRPSFSPDGKLLAWPTSAPGEPIGLWDLTRLKPLVVSP